MLKPDAYRTPADPGQYIVPSTDEVALPRILIETGRSTTRAVSS